MQAETNCSSPNLPSHSPSPSRRPANAFSDSFLSRVRALDQPASTSGTLLAGPWEVEELQAGEHRLYGVVRRGEPVAEGGTAFAVLLDRTSALQTAAALPALGRASHLRLGRHRKRLGVPLHDGKTFLGHLVRAEPGLLPLLHAVRSLQAQPDGLAQVLEALGPEELALVGRLLADRVDGPG